ncbi:hypothetical protein [Longispora albida]|uniref:hypothetical protein n=1 Tax=Longispora albida TaxID=203523 RepID=UPI0003782F74|nr:hypothetical protein [Longispora albida]
MRAASTLVLLGTAAALLAACSGTPPQAKPTATGTKPAPSQEPRARLGGLAAAALDAKYTANYTYTPRSGTARTVSVSLGADGTWRVDIPGGALGGAANISMLGLKDGVYQCGAAPAPAPTGSATPGATAAPSTLPVTCAKLPSPLPAKYDPRIQHLFTDWLPPLTKPTSALSVSATQQLAGSTGACFSVESTSASVGAPVDPGVYCYSDSGTLTGARIGTGTLVLAGTPAPPPASVPAPGPLTGTNPMQLAAVGASATPTKKP